MVKLYNRYVSNYAAAPYAILHWKPRVVMIPTLSPLVPPYVMLITTTSGAIDDDKIFIMTTFDF